VKRHKHLKEIIKIETKYISKIIKLRGELSDIAITKSETAMLERMEASNGKFALLKEQASEFATRADIKSLDDKISATNRIVYIGLGIILALQFIIPLMK
jgi:hypothetical protein